MLGAINFQNLVGIQTEIERYILNLCKQKTLEKVQNPSTSKANSFVGPNYSTISTNFKS